MSDAKERKPFSETRFYPVFFMILVTAIAIGVLATFYHGTAARVEAYRAYRHQQTVLALFDIDTTGQTPGAVAALYLQHVTDESKDGYQWYRVGQNGVLKGWAFPISGSGLWGSISAMLAVSPDYTTIERFAIVDQNETPGLGGRITESWFTGQFTGKKLGGDFTLVAEDTASPAPAEVRQITGATVSSRAVATMIAREYDRISKLLELRHD